MDGNKRTAHVCYRTFLALNDVEVEAGDEDKYMTILALAEGKLAEADFAKWLRHHTNVDHAGCVQEPRAAAYRAPPHRDTLTHASLLHRLSFRGNLRSQRKSSLESVGSTTSDFTSTLSRRNQFRVTPRVAAE